MTAKEFTFLHLPVYQQPDAVFPVVHQAQNAYGAWHHMEKRPHMRRVRKGKSGSPDLCGKVLGVKGLVARHHQQVKSCLLPVAKEQIFADMDPQNLLDFRTLLNGSGLCMIYSPKGDLQVLQQIIACHFMR